MTTNAALGKALRIGSLTAIGWTTLVLVPLGQLTAQEIEPSQIASDAMAANPDNQLQANYNFPAPNPELVNDEMREWPAHHLLIDEAGGITLDGNATQPADLLGSLQSTETPGFTDTFGWWGTNVSASEDVPFRAVLPVLMLFNEANFDDFTLAGLEEFRTFDIGNESKPPPEATNRFQGRAGRYELPVFVAYSQSHGGCFASLNGRIISSTTLYDTAFTTLDSLVQRAGGVEAILDDPKILHAIVARIQARPDTPWSCIAGAAYNIQASGYPVVRFEAVDQN